jgi:DNA uptake protein ComE-like DNA-binding protein
MEKHWTDYFYYSRHERRALIAMSAIIVAGSILIALANHQNPIPAVAETIEQPQKQPADAAHASPTANVESGTSNAGHTPKNNRENTATTRTNRQTGGRNTHYPARTEKYAAGTIVELNAADTATLKKVPGIGSYFAKNIIYLRDKLGGFYSVEQLKEVRLMDDEKFITLKPWFAVDTTAIARLQINTLSWTALVKHPYINGRQASIICRLRDIQPLKGWENLALLDEFSDAERERLRPYITFD